MTWSGLLNFQTTKPPDNKNPPFPRVKRGEAFLSHQFFKKTGNPVFTSCQQFWYSPCQLYFRPECNDSIPKNIDLLFARYLEIYIKALNPNKPETLYLIRIHDMANRFIHTSTRKNPHPMLSPLSPIKARKGKVVTAEEAVSVLQDIVHWFEKIVRIGLGDHQGR